MSPALAPGDDKDPDMDVSRGLWLCACAALFSTAAGCVAPYPYSPYGIYPGQMYPGTNGVPGTLTPAPNSTGGSGAGATSPTPRDSSADSSNSDAPPFNPTGNQDPVPKYPDPGDLKAPPGSGSQNMFDQNQGAFHSDNEGVSKAAYDQRSEPKQGAAPVLLQSAEVTLGDPGVVPAKGEFVEPAKRFPGEGELKAPFADDSGLNPFAHDPQYRNLRGLVSFDEATQTWALMYNDNPGNDDEYGGMFTLANDDRFGVLNENDVVYVEGKISPSERDTLGKPKYVVEYLKKLQPASDR